MKVKDIRAMAPEEMKAKIEDLHRELSIEYGTRSSAGGKSRNYGKMRTIRRTVARMLTAIRAKELGLNAPKPAKAAATPKVAAAKPAAKPVEKK
jgi:ribosomal protein L29